MQMSLIAGRHLQDGSLDLGEFPRSELLPQAFADTIACDEKWAPIRMHMRRPPGRSFRHHAARGGRSESPNSLANGGGISMVRPEFPALLPPRKRTGRSSIIED